MQKPMSFVLPSHYPAETQAILFWFEEIAKIPRKSKHEESIKTWLKSFAKDRKLEFKEDKAGNLLIMKPGTPGQENSAPVIIQGHLDMVCEKIPGSTHDFLRDPIKLKYHDGWLMADGTSLGADNGIAIAYMLYLLDSSGLKHPPLECLMTIDEETGLTGALGLEQGFLTGKTLINVDSEEMGVFIAGCAGGTTSHIKIPIEREESYAHQGMSYFSLKISGLSGGHSGIDIHRGKGNAIKILMRLLSKLSKSVTIKVFSIEGGTAHNAIAREAFADIAIAQNECSIFKDVCARWEVLVKKEFQMTDSHLAVEYVEIAAPVSPSKPLTLKSRDKVFNFSLCLTHGPIYYAAGFPHLVETSANFATITVDQDHVSILSSQRSAIKSRLEEVSAQCAALVHLVEGSLETADGYPPWEPQFDAPLLKLCTQIYEEIFAKKAKVEVIHAGLETGVIGEKYPGLAMISFGPTILGAHSPDEKMCVADIGSIWKLIRTLLQKL